MRHYIEMRCRTCNSIMVYVQRRGASHGVWICPVCASARRGRPSSPDEDEPVPPDRREEDQTYRYQ
jgi:ribosomal protein L37AE/L43A